MIISCWKRKTDGRTAMTVQKSPLYRLLAILLTCAMVLTLAPCNAIAEEEGQETLTNPEPTVAVADVPAASVSAEEPDLEDLGVTVDDAADDVTDEVGEPATENGAADADGQPQEQVSEQPIVEVGESQGDKSQDDVAVLVQDASAATRSEVANGESVVVAEASNNKRSVANPTVKVSAYVQKKGWLKTVANGKVAGTTGKKLRLEALRVSLSGAKVSGTIMLMGHVQGKGWTGWKSGSVGTTGQSKRLEAIAIKLTGKVKKEYDVYYRAHVSKLGWMGWTKNGKKAGTKGFSAPMEAVQIRLVRKGDPAPGQKSKVSAAYYTNPSVSYKAYCQGHGWMGTKKNGVPAGTTGEGKRLEAMSVWLSGGSVRGSIKYRSYVAGSGWQGACSNGETSGTVNQSKAVQAIKISLSGDVAALCDVYYKVHMAEAGWLGWAKNGQVAGAPGVGKNVEAIQVRIVHKGAKAIGSTSYHEVDKSFFDDDMTKKAQGYSSPTGWLIMVDTNKTKLGVYRGSFGNWKKHGSWRISCGQPQTPTIKGVFSVGDRGYVFGHGYSCYWYVQWHGAYLFHSVKYYEGTFKIMDGRLGEHISMGCVRMDIERAKWIYDNIPSGTTVVTY